MKATGPNGGTSVAVDGDRYVFATGGGVAVRDLPSMRGWDASSAVATYRRQGTATVLADGRGPPVTLSAAEIVGPIHATR